MLAPPSMMMSQGMGGGEHYQMHAHAFQDQHSAMGQMSDLNSFEHGHGSNQNLAYQLLPQFQPQSRMQAQMAHAHAIQALAQSPGGLQALQMYNLHQQMGQNLVAQAAPNSLQDNKGD